MKTNVRPLRLAPDASDPHHEGADTSVSCYLQSVSRRDMPVWSARELCTNLHLGQRAAI